MVEQNIERLEWDSLFFGYEVGKMQINNQEKLNLDFFFKQAKKFKLIYVFSESDLFISKFKLVDKKVIFHQEIKNFNSEKEIVIESFNKDFHDFDQLKELALESGVYSRFLIDKNFKNNEYNKLYSRWIENAVDKINSFDVIIESKDEKIIGFTTLNKKSAILADLGLVAVSKEYRGLGIGKKIINESIQRSKQAGFKEIQVVTQLDNKAAIQLYTSANFKIAKITNIYHFWNL